MDELTNKFLAELNKRDQVLQQQKVEHNELIKQHREFNERLLNRIAELEADSPESSSSTSRSSGGGGGSHAAHASRPLVRNPEDIIKEKYLSLYQNFQKCTKLKDYKFSTQENIREWIKRLDMMINNLATAVDLKVTDISNTNYINLVRSKLDYSVITELDLRFVAHAPDPLTWETVTKDQLYKLLIEHFGQHEPDVAAVLKCFSANRYKKGADISCRNFYSKWMDKLPLCLKPTSDEEKDYFIDLIQRSLYYHALDDRYLEQKLSDIKESDQTLQAFHHESIRAEAQREHYQSVTATSNVLDSSNNVSVNKFENYTANKNWQHPRSRGSDRGAGHGRGSHQPQLQSLPENTLQHSDAKSSIGE